MSLDNSKMFNLAILITFHLSSCHPERAQTARVRVEGPAVADHQPTSAGEHLGYGLLAGEVPVAFHYRRKATQVGDQRLRDLSALCHLSYTNHRLVAGLEPAASGFPSEVTLVFTTDHIF